MKTRTLHKKKFLITKDHYESKTKSLRKMQAPPYHEKEYWKRKEESEKHLHSEPKEIDIEKLLAEIKKNDGK